MKKSIALFLVVSLVSGLALAQQADVAAVHEASSGMPLGISPAQSPSSLLDLSRVTFSHSYSISYIIWWCHNRQLHRFSRTVIRFRIFPAGIHPVPSGCYVPVCYMNSLRSYRWCSTSVFCTILARCGVPTLAVMPPCCPDFSLTTILRRSSGCRFHTSVTVVTILPLDPRCIGRGRVCCIRTRAIAGNRLEYI